MNLSLLYKGLFIEESLVKPILEEKSYRSQCFL